MQAFTKTYKNGTHLFHENDHSRELYIIQSGTIRVYRKIGSRNVDLARLSKGAVLGEMALIDGKPRSASAVAAEDTMVIIIDAETFHKRIAGVPPWFMSMIRTTSEKIRKANTRLEATQSAGRCLHVVIALQYQFLRFGETAGGDTSGKSLDVSQTEGRIVPLLSVSGQNVTQMLAGLQKKGVIDLTGGRIVLCDQAKLDGCCDYLRLLFKKSFDKLAAISGESADLIVALSEAVAASAPSDKGVEIAGADVAAACAKSNAGSSALRCAEELRDLELCTFTKATAKESDGAALAGYQFVFNPAAYKKALIYCTYKDFVPEPV
jgi:CRP/FNR family cyclic AMP-dependent transcriptional regulator